MSWYFPRADQCQDFRRKDGDASARPDTGCSFRSFSLMLKRQSDLTEDGVVRLLHRLNNPQILRHSAFQRNM